MSKLDELEKMIAEDLERSSDAEQVKRLAIQKQLLQEAKNEETTFLQEHQKLKEEYVKIVKSAVVSSEQPKTGTKPRTAMEIAKDLGLMK